MAALLASIELQLASADIKITILDNGSAGVHPERVRQLEDRHNARLLRSDRNLLVAGKRMLEDEIYAHERPDVLVRVDDDVVLSPGWLAATLAVLESGVAVCGSVEDHGGDVSGSPAQLARQWQPPAYSGGRSQRRVA